MDNRRMELAKLFANNEITEKEFVACVKMNDAYFLEKDSRDKRFFAQQINRIVNHKKMTSTLDYLIDLAERCIDRSNGK